MFLNKFKSVLKCEKNINDFFLKFGSLLIKVNCGVLFLVIYVCCFKWFEKYYKRIFFIKCLDEVKYNFIIKFFFLGVKIIVYLVDVCNCNIVFLKV